MPITVAWDNPEHTIILMHFEGKWTWEELLDVEEVINRHLDQTSQPLDFIVDMTNAGPPAPSVPAQFRQVGREISHPMLRRTVVVGASSLIEIYLRIFSSLQSVAAQKITTASTIQEAHSLLGKPPETDTP
jgi:hypothetical protein